MQSNRILAFSSSRQGNGNFMELLLPVINNFIGDTALRIAFIPFASVKNDFDNYGAMVRDAMHTLPYTIDFVTHENATKILEQADVIMTGGGNTFKLLHDIYKFNLLDIIRRRVDSGVPYIGWSAGANITGPTIATTNDMPVIEPKSFNALGLLPFQINPHYTSYQAAGHNGETRDQRLEEFQEMNPGVPVVALPEGTALKLEKDQLHFIGEEKGKLFFQQNEVDASRDIEPGEELTFLL